MLSLWIYCIVDADVIIVWESDVRLHIVVGPLKSLYIYLFILNFIIKNFRNVHSPTQNLG